MELHTEHRASRVGGSGVGTPGRLHRRGGLRAGPCTGSAVQQAGGLRGQVAKGKGVPDKMKNQSMAWRREAPGRSGALRGAAGRCGSITRPPVAHTARHCSRVCFLHWTVRSSQTGNALRLPLRWWRRAPDSHGTHTRTPSVFRLFCEHVPVAPQTLAQ